MPGRYGAFALAMILSLAAAIPIVFVCKLQKQRVKPAVCLAGMEPLRWR